VSATKSTTGTPRRKGDRLIKFERGAVAGATETGGFIAANAEQGRMFSGAEHPVWFRFGIPFYTKLRKIVEVKIKAKLR
jgi:hypothetical protein